jgi:hypothetical protein
VTIASPFPIRSTQAFFCSSLPAASRIRAESTHETKCGVGASARPNSS